MVNLQEEAEFYLGKYVSIMEELGTTIGGINDLLKRINAANKVEEALPQKTCDTLNSFLTVLNETEEILTIPDRVVRLTLYSGLSTNRENSGYDDLNTDYWEGEAKRAKQRIDDLKNLLEKWIKKPIDLRVAPLVLSLQEIVSSGISGQRLAILDYRPLDHLIYNLQIN